MKEDVLDEAIKELRTIQDMVRWGASLFEHRGLCYGHGCDNPADEALWLISHALALPFEYLLEMKKARLTSSERQQVVKLFWRRAEERVPSAYLTQHIDFAGLPFYVDERVLIPRSPLAELIQNQFQPWIDASSVSRILEIGTGSACIAIACAYAFDDVLVDAIDCSEAALEVANRNVGQHHMHDHVRLRQGDVYSPLSDERYDIIVSNPPYVDRVTMATLPEEYQHEPIDTALAAGKDGLDIVARILADAADHLTAHGILIVEVGASQSFVEQRYPDVPFTWLEFENGGEGVFLLTAHELKQHDFKGR